MEQPDAAAVSSREAHAPPGAHLGTSLGQRVLRGSVFSAYRRLSVHAATGEDCNSEEELLPVAEAIDDVVRVIEHLEAMGDACDDEGGPALQRATAYCALRAEGVEGLARQLQEALEKKERDSKWSKYADPSFRSMSEEKQQRVTRFMQFVRGGKRAEVEEMLAADNSLAEARDWGGTSPLHVSVILKDLELSRLLIHHGASLSQADATGSAVAAYASKKDPLAGEQLRLLESSLRQPRALTDEERRFAAFRLAASQGDLETLAALHELDGGLVFMQDERAQTALIAACASCQYPAAKLLLLYGSDWQHRSWLSGLQALPSQFVPDKARRRELKEFAWWQTPRGRREAERLRLLNDLNERRAQEAANSVLMTLEESRARRVLANEAVTRELCLSTATAAFDRALRLASRSVVRRRVKEIEEELERERRAAVLERRLAREEALRRQKERRRRMFLQFAEALCANARAVRRELVRAEHRARRERAEQEAAERERLALLERLRLKRQAELRAMQERAREEWEQLQDELERQQRAAFAALRPQRLLAYNRLRNGAAAVSSSNAFLLEKRVFLPRSPSAGGTRRAVPSKKK